MKKKNLELVRQVGLDPRDCEKLSKYCGRGKEAPLFGRAFESADPSKFTVGAHILHHHGG